MTNEPTVFVVDDDAGMRESLHRLFTSAGMPAEVFGSADEFLGQFDSERPGCLVLDVRMPGTSGLELQEHLIARGCRIPVIVVTGFGDVPMAVRGMRNGAVEFIEKPYRAETLLTAVRVALARDAELRISRSQRQQASARLSRLTDREQEIKGYLVTGESVKEIAVRLSLSPKTVQVHRASVLEKTGCDSVVKLARLVMMTGAESSGSPSGA